MAVKLWTKPQTQQTIKDLRKYGYTVTKEAGIYKSKEADEKGKPVFSAMPGSGGYLVMYDDRLFTQAA